VEEVAIIKITPSDMRGKYKIGQHWAKPYRIKMAQNILKREGPVAAKAILDEMGLRLLNGGDFELIREPVM
jgi:hypothetical protein